MTNTTKSIFLTAFGYIIGTIAQLIVYPLFGIPMILSTALQLGVIFTVVAFVSNYIALKVIAKLERSR